MARAQQKHLHTGDRDNVTYEDVSSCKNDGRGVNLKKKTLWTEVETSMARYTAVATKRKAFLVDHSVMKPLAINLALPSS